jgi:thiosulfate reductase/polysulfide reductase chain A
MLPFAILNEDPYPLKALIAFRFDPLKSIPDSNLMLKALEKLDLIVTIDVNYSDIAWYSDVILPESSYLERTDCIQQANGLKPQMFLRKQAVTPRYDTLEGAIILKRIADKIGIGNYFPYESMEDLVRWQLDGTGFKIEDFEAKGFVAYGKDQLFWDRNDGIKLKTPSGKIEFVSSLLENAGFNSFPEYQPVHPPSAENKFRLVVGRTAVHTHVSTQNNSYLNELVSENQLWINSKKASKLGIKDGSIVEVSSPAGSGQIKAYITDLMHPEAVFMLHGFGHKAKKADRAYKRGISDSVLQENITDKIGGSPALHDTFVTVKAA